MNNINITGIMNKYAFSLPILIHLLLIGIAFSLIYVIFPRKCGLFLDNISNVNKKLVIITIIPFILGHILFYISDQIYARNIHIIHGKIINEILNEILKSIKENPQPDINRLNIITNFMKLLERFDIMHILVLYFFPTIIMSFGLFFYFLRVDKTIAIMTLILSIISLITIIFFGRKCMYKSEKRYNTDLEFYNEIRDIIINIENVSTEKNIEYEVLRLKEIRDKIKHNYISSEIYNTNFKGSIRIIQCLFLIILGSILIKLHNENKITKGEVVAYIYIIITLVNYYDSSSSEVDNLFYHIGNYKEAHKYFKNFKNVNKEDKEINIKDGEIKYKNINVKLGNKQILKNFSTIIKPNDITGIIGEIGSGKSTLIKLILGYHQYEGEIYIDNINIKEYKYIEIRKYIGYIPQHPVFFNRTIYENIEYGTNLNRQEIETIIKEYDLSEFMNRFTNKMNTIIKNNGENISGGQKQILYLIKIILLNKKIILMDEPTSNLDTYHSELFIKIINKLKNKTIIIITHDESIKKIFNNIIYIKKIE
jgi:ATP-binding cassette subfamily B multidrug efflux pump